MKLMDRKLEPYRVTHKPLNTPYDPTRTKAREARDEHKLFETRIRLQFRMAQKAQKRTETTREKFQRLADAWKQEAAFLPSARKMATLASYQQIIGMGEAALPLILNDLREEPDYWFWALRAISGTDPVPPILRGDMQAMSDAWVQWGIENRLIR